MRIFVNQRLRDRVKRRGVKAKRAAEAEPKPYPLEGADWSSCDESEDDSEDLTVPATMGFGDRATRERCELCAGPSMYGNVAALRSITITLR